MCIVVRRIWVQRTGYRLYTLLLLSCSAVSNPVTLWTSSPFTISRSLLRLMSIELMMPSNHLILSLLSPPALCFSTLDPENSCLGELGGSGGGVAGGCISFGAPASSGLPPAGGLAGALWESSEELRVGRQRGAAAWLLGSCFPCTLCLLATRWCFQVPEWASCPL